ncbi:hypothetical protein PGTUg99_009337 [Puccinia graminis f. sp. tritici]|uniref:Uncharacterized protein n=1 Tax=Puccinia graminis f. sp. tritici TaxID=56615 RepID=A0A5B0QL19_PUCGR|nr:hypothetical protein PGTUg99_009337 [Puccinia graminis f. sp. tritici]
MLTLRSMVLTTLITKAWAAMFLCDIEPAKSPGHISWNYMILDSEAPQGTGTFILKKSDKDGGEIISDRPQGIEFKNQLKTKLWVYNGNKEGKYVEFPPNGVAQLESIDKNRLWVGTIERPYTMRISTDRYNKMASALLNAINEDRFILQEPHIPKHQEAMAHLNLKEGTNARPRIERSWEYPPKENPSDARPITLIRDWDKKLLKEVRYSGKSWWIIHRDFISDSENSGGLPFRITSGRPLFSKKNPYRVVKNVGKPKPIAVHVGDFSSLLPNIGAGKESSIFFNKPGNWAVITLVDQAAPLQHDVYKLLTSWNQDQVEEGIPLRWRERIIHSCAKIFKQEGSDYEFLRKVKAN